MSSTALTDFLDRLEEVQQLLDAHAALVRIKRAEAAMNGGSGTLQQAMDAVKHLVSPASPGRPPEVQALNSAAIVLLSAHLQGFITDIFSEAAKFLIGERVEDIDALIEAAPVRGNPNEQNITKLFASVGFIDALSGVSWQKMNNKSLRKKLKEFNELRNKVAHGKTVKVSKAKVESYKNVWANFARRFDAALKNRIKQASGSSPW